MSKHDESRRKFLVGAAVGAGAVATGGLPADALAQAQKKKKTAAAAPSPAAGRAYFLLGGACRPKARVGGLALNESSRRQCRKLAICSRHPPLPVRGRWSFPDLELERLQSPARARSAS